MTVKPVAVEHLTFAYDGLSVLEDVSFEVSAQEFITIVGPNGGGKTTLIKLLLGLLRPLRGTVSILGQPPKQVRSRIGYMPQRAHLDPSFPATVLDVALMGRLGNGLMIGPVKREDRDAAMQALEDVSLAELCDRPFSSISGGQRRRLMIARALACQPEVLILDEPTAHLDPTIERQLYSMLGSLVDRMTILLASHDLAYVTRHSGRVLCVNRRVVVHPTRELDEGLLSEIYGDEMRMVRHDRHDD